MGIGRTGAGAHARIVVRRARVVRRSSGVSSQLDPVTVDIAAQNRAPILGYHARDRVRRSLDLEERRARADTEVARGVAIRDGWLDVFPGTSEVHAVDVAQQVDQVKRGEIVARKTRAQIERQIAGLQADG